MLTALPLESTPTLSRSLDALDLAMPVLHGGLPAPRLDLSVQALNCEVPPWKVPALGKKQLQEAIDCLNSQHPVLRVGVDNSHNYGHQNASVVLAKNLRQYGYRGWLEFVPLPGAMDRLQQLLPGVSTRAWGTQKFQQAKVRVLRRPHGRASVGMFGALDLPASAAHLLGAQSTVVLQPLNWSEPTGVAVDGQFCGLSQPLGTYQDVTPAPISALGTLEQALVDAAAPLRRGAVHLTKRVLRGEVDLMVVYGVHRSKATALPRLMDGLDAALQARAQVQAHGSTRPTVVLLVAPPTHTHMAQAPRCTLDNPQAVDAWLQRCPKGARLTVVTEPLPQAAFQVLLRLCTWPPAVEGANTINWLRLANIPHVVLPNNLNQWPRSVPKDPEASRCAKTTAALYAPRAYPYKVAETLLLARLPDSHLRRYFTSLSRSAASPAYDLAARGVRMLHKMLQTRPPRGARASGDRHRR